MGRIPKHNDEFDGVIADFPLGTSPVQTHQTDPHSRYTANAAQCTLNRIDDMYKGMQNSTVNTKHMANPLLTTVPMACGSAKSFFSCCEKEKKTLVWTD